MSKVQYSYTRATVTVLITNANDKELSGTIECSATGTEQQWNPATRLVSSPSLACRVRLFEKFKRR